MFGKKKEEKRPANARRSNLAQFGLLDIPDDFGNPDAIGDDDDDDDDDLEAELMALTSGSAPSRAKRGKPKAASANLDAMVAASMKDIPSDDESSVDENDPELLAELGDLVPEDEAPPPAPVPSKPSVTSLSASSTSQVALLEQRLAMYREAETNAKQAGDTSRARRFSRGLKTLTDQLKQAKAGRVVPEDEIPPAVATNISKKPDVVPSSQPEPSGSDTPYLEQPQAASSPQVPSRPSRTAPLPPASTPASLPSVSQPATAQEDVSQLAELLRRQLCFKQAALAAKKSGDTENALKYMRVCKQFDSVIAAVKSGSPVDLSEMPSPPQAPEMSVASPPAPKVRESEVQGEGDSAADETQEPTPKGPCLPPELLNPLPPTSVADALQQRFVRYQAEEKLAKDSGNTSKSRRMGRIAKQYQDAIKLHKAGKPIPVDELPTPPGYAPIPVPGAPAPAAPEAATSAEGDVPATPTPAVAPPTPPKVAKPSPSVPQRQPSEVRKSPQSRQEKQKLLLLARQKEFKEAALAAKRRGEIEQARELLRQAKGFDSLIEASNNGLPVDLATLPVPPGVSASLDTEFEYISADDCEPGGSGEIYEKLEEDLTKQIKLCLATRDHFRATGDVAGANRFEQLAVQSKRDLNMVKACRQRGETLPRFKYETRSFSILQCCTDLGDNDLELNIVQGISYNVPNPKEVDTYVKYEFPFPQETLPKDKTALIRDTNNPQYNQSFLLPIARTSRACQRVFKRHGVKLEVWSKGGFLRSDTLLGTAIVKLQPLETKCILHESFPLMDGRKAVGGQLEVKIRIRHPIVTRQVEQRQERWLVVAETT